MILYISILLTLAGYSTGAGLAAHSRKRIADPGLVDCGLLGLTWLFEIAYFRSTPHPAMPLAIPLVGSVAVGFVLHSFLNSRTRFATAGSGEFVFIHDHGDGTVPATRPLWRRAWFAWKNFAAQSADFQGRLLVSLVYFTLLWPFSFFVPSPPHSDKRLSNWQPRKISPDHVKDSLRQF